MDKIRDLVGKPVSVHVTFRPEAYNTLIGGAEDSAHKFGQAMDWSVNGMSCDDLRILLIPKLEEFQVRMENKPGSNWVHIDRAQPHPNRYFIP
jgi:uncharacterized protein YcbK (DUF882 family)